MEQAYETKRRRIFSLNQPVHIDKKDFSVFNTFSIDYNINQLNEETATLKKPVEKAALEQAVDTLLYVFPTYRECCYIENGELYSYYSDRKPSIFSDEGMLERGELNS